MNMSTKNVESMLNIIQTSTEVEGKKYGEVILVKNL